MSKKIIKVIALFLTFLLLFGTLPLNVVFAEGVDAAVQRMNVAAEKKNPADLWSEIVAKESPIPVAIRDKWNFEVYCEYISDQISEKGRYLTLDEIIEAIKYANANPTEIKTGILNDLASAVSKKITLSSIGAVELPTDLKTKIRSTTTATILPEWTKVEGDAADLFTVENGSLILNSRPLDADASATLVVTVTNAEVKKDIKINATIKKYADENEAVLDTITFDLIKGENQSIDNINKNLNLVTSLEGKTVTWTSSKPSVIANDGKVTQPTYWGNTEILTLTAKIGSYTKVFNAVVNPTRFNQYKKLNVENGGFEKVGFKSIPNWTRMEGTLVDNGIFENSTERVFDGNYSMKLDDPQVGMFNGGSLGVREGHRYIGEIMVYVEEGASVGMMMMFFDMNSIQVGYAYGNLVGEAGGWRVYRIEATAPRGAVMARVYPMLNKSSTAPAYFDNANIYEMPLLHNANFVPADIDATWFPADGKLTSTTANAFAGTEYSFTGNASAATTAAINFYMNDAIVYTYTKDISGPFDVRATAPTAVTAVSVTLGTTDRSIFSNLELNISQKGTQVPDGSFEQFAETVIPSWDITTYDIGGSTEPLIDNGDFEGESLEDWIPVTGLTTIERTTEKVASGSYSAKIVSTVASKGVSSKKIDILPGKEYTIKFNAFSTDPTAYFYINWWDASGTFLNAKSFQITSSSGFKSFSETITSPIGAAQLSIQVYFVGGTATNRTVYLDDLIVVMGDGTNVGTGSGTIVQNGGFEGESLTDWDTAATTKVTLTRTNEKAATGSFSGKFVSTSPGVGLNTKNIKVIPGNEYNITYKAQTVDMTAHLYTRWLKEDGSSAGSKNYWLYSYSNPEAFHDFSIDTVAPVDAAYLAIQIYFVQENPPYVYASDRTVYLDDFKIETEAVEETGGSFANIDSAFATDGANGLTLSVARADSYWIPVLSGKDYAFAVDTKCDTVGAAKATVTYFDNAGSPLSSEVVTNLSTSNETLKLTTKAPDMAFDVRITLETEEAAYFDNAKFFMVGDTIGNPSFENTDMFKPGHHATQWQSWGGVLASIYGAPKTDFPDGVFGLEVRGLSFGGSVNSSMIKATPGVDYTARVMANSKKGGSIRLSFYDVNFKYISSSNATAFSGEEWTKYSANSVAPAGTAYATVDFVAAAGDEFIVDNTEFFTTVANIGTNTQMLIDDFIIMNSSDVERTFHQAEISDPILYPSYNHDQNNNGHQVYGSVLYDEDEKIYKMWYQGINKMLNAELDYLSALACYATSKDGVNWEYPSLGLFEYNGSKDNNIFGNYHIPSVFKDYDEPDPNKRYKMVSYHHTGSHYSYFYSADGLVWTNAGEFSKGFDVINAMHDEFNNQYVAVVKRQINKRNQWTVVDDEEFNVQSYVMANTLADLIDSQNSYRADSYGQGMYNKDGLYIGFNWVFNIPGTYAMEGYIKPQLTYSRDLTDEWHRPTRMPMMPAAEVLYHNTNSTCALTAAYAIENGDEVWMYFCQGDSDHAQGLGSIPFKTMHIAKWRMDGFASLDSGNSEGVITTRPLSFDGTALKLNADASKGAIRVELLDASGNPISGYTKADCDVITTDSISHTVSWGGKKDISALKNSGVSLKIYSENSDIYSFEFGEPTKSVYTESETEDGSKLVGSVVEGGEFELPESTYTKDGYAFAGWKVSGTDEILKPGDKITVEDDMTLTAVWNLYGDFDGDDKVDAKETAMVREYLIGKPDAEFIKEFADVNTDGDVDICDLVVFIENLK